MNRIRINGAIAAALLVLATHTVGADVRAEQKTRIEFGGMLGRMVNFFGGKSAREGVVSTVAVKGDRKTTTSGQTTQIIDLAEEKIYDVDTRRKSFKVTTFAEIRRQMEEAQKRAEQDAQSQGDPEPAAADPDAKEVDVDVDVKNTGEKKALNGFDTHRVVMTITLREKGRTVEQSGGMITTTDMWVAPTIAAMKEISDFDARYAEKLYSGLSGASAQQLAAAMALYPMMKQALGRMNAENAKIDGTPILTTVTMDAVKSEEEMAQQSKPAEEPARPAAGLGGLLGGLAKKAAPKKEEASARTTFMTSTNEVMKVATEVAAADVAIPAGFKQDN
jgi:hypothetical protein